MQNNDLSYPMPYGKPIRTIAVDSEKRVSEWVTLFTHSCFAPGTPVVTLDGTRAIETIQPGDQVLALDPQSGELSFQVVSETSVRVDVPQLKIRAAGREISATVGHRFWVEGRGWRMARQLAVGDALRTLEGTAVIESIEPAENQNAHGLTIEGFPTYFVGDGQLLVHDKTAPRPVDAASCPLNWQAPTAPAVTNSVTAPRSAIMAK